MSKKTMTSFLAASCLVIAIAVICSTQLAGVAGAQLTSPYGTAGYGGYGGYGVNNPYGSSYGGYGNYGQQVPYAGQQAPYTIQQAPAGNVNAIAGQSTADNSLTIQGLEGIQGFTTGANKLSLAVMPVSQQNGQMGFQLIGFAVSSPDAGTAAVYSLSSPIGGVIDPTQNTLQIDLSNLANVISNAGYVDSSQVYDTIRTDAKVLIIDVDMNYQGQQGSQTTFSVTSVSIIPPDGKMQAFSMQQPTQLVIDGSSSRLAMVTFPQMDSAFGDYYGESFDQVLPIVYAQPVPVLAPVFVPYLTPFPIFFGFVGFSPFFFGSSFVSFFNFNTFHGHFPIHDRNFGRSEFNQFRQGRNQAGGRTGTPSNRISNPGSRTGAGNLPGQGRTGMTPGSREGISGGNRQGGNIGGGIRSPSAGIGGNIGGGMGNQYRMPAGGIGTGIGGGMGNQYRMPTGGMSGGMGGGLGGGRMGGGIGGGMGGGFRR